MVTLKRERRNASYFTQPNSLFKHPEYHDSDTQGAAGKCHLHKVICSQYFNENRRVLTKRISSTDTCGSSDKSLYETSSISGVYD